MEPESQSAPEVAPPTAPIATRLRPRTGGRVGALLALGIAAAFVLLLAVTLVGRSLRGAPLPLAVAITFLPYLYAMLGAAAFALWALIPDRRLVPGVLCGTILVAGGLWGPSWSARPEAAAGAPVRVMSWNVRRLWGGPDDGGDPGRCVVETIGEAAPDVLTLLEVSRRDTDALAERLGLECVHSDYHGTGAVGVGGLATCVRGERWRLLRGSAQRFVDDERWVYLFAEIERGGEVFNLLAVHLYPYPFTAARLREGVTGLAQGQPEPLLTLGRAGGRIVRAQADQTRMLLSRVERLNDPTVVAGDFNSTRDARLHVALREHLVDAWERGGSGYGGTHRFFGLAPLRIDFVYVSPEFGVSGARVPDVGCSDHRPVVTDLVLRARADRASPP